MTSLTDLKGRSSELIATIQLMNSGYKVHEPQTTEKYDLLLIEEETNSMIKAQVKTIHRRSDRNNALVVFSKDGNNKAYTKEDVDLIVGVLDGKYVFLIENTEQKEYWSQTFKIAKRKWRML